MASESPLILTDDAIVSAARSFLADARMRPERFVLGIAGIAGSGKSTLAQRLTNAMNHDQPGSAAFIPMDGFHLTNAVLESRGWKSRKGAPFTYDAEAFVGLLRRYRHRQQTGAYPVYCREVHEPVASSQRVTTATQVIVTEGQYLLSAEKPWDTLVGVMGVCWWLDVSPEAARGWLMKRDTSVGRTPAEAEAKYQNNDRLNTDFVLADRREPDRMVRWPGVESSA